MAAAMAAFVTAASLIVLRRLGGRHRRIALDRDWSAFAIGQDVGAGLPLRAWLCLCGVSAGTVKSAAQFLGWTAFIMRAPGVSGRAALFYFFLRFLRRD